MSRRHKCASPLPSYVINHPYTGEMSCNAAKSYRNSTKQRQEKEAQTLAKLTRWDINKIRSKINFISVKNSSKRS